MVLIDSDIGRITLPALSVGEITQPNFFVRDIPVYGDLILAPMDGYSDLPFRSICRALGSAISYTEFVNVDEVSRRKPKPETIRKLEYTPHERPVTFQIYGHQEDRLVETASVVEEMNPDIVDVNMGCYVHDIAERGAGSGMLRDPGKIARVIARMVQALRVPVTAKIRLGWDDTSRNYIEVARILEDSGASLVAVHGRTKAQAFRGAADWDAIGEVKRAVKIPVIANGDVKTVADIARIKAQTGCDGVMIGRGAIGNPWIFSRRDRDQVPIEEKIALLRKHLALNLEFYGERVGLILFRKHASRYIAGLYGAAEMRFRLLTCNNIEEFDRMVGEIQDADHNRRIIHSSENA
ncbi:MAG: tRNA dihydrouridine synthase DusB [Chloroflexi bacterium]|nr:tRNA dihydrouridine synthase DusB [Chloroflexota bacterium]